MSRRSNSQKRRRAKKRQRAKMQKVTENGLSALGFSIYLSGFLCIFFAIRVAAYLPQILSLNISKLSTPDEGISQEKTNTEWFFTEYGIGYPPFVISSIAFITCGILAFSLKSDIDNSKGLFLKFVYILCSSFGVLITLFSIWGK